SDIVIRDEWLELLQNGSKISSPGALGCLMSHLQIIKEAKEQNFKSILIFEDDIILHNEFNDQLRKINSVPLDYEIIYLGASQYKTNLNSISINGTYYKADLTGGTFAYIIKSS